MVPRVTKSVSGFGMVKVGFRHGPEPEMGVRHPPLARL